MTKNLRIQVTEADIAKAIISDSYKCVVVQAIARQIPDSVKIEADIQTVRFTRLNTQQRYVYLTPFQVQGYIVAFDAGDKIEPFEFQLRSPMIVKRRVAVKPTPEPEQLAMQLERIDPEDMPTDTTEVVRNKPSVRAKDDDNDSPIAAYARPKAVWTNDGPMPPPRVFKKKSRSYGMRVLRYNQNRGNG